MRLPQATCNKAKIIFINVERVDGESLTPDCTYLCRCSNPLDGVIMLLLRDDPVWVDVNSDVIRIAPLLEEVNQKSVTGFIEFDFSSFSAIIFLNEGKIAQCAEIKNEKACPVKKSDILGYLEKKSATVGLYKMKKEVVMLTCRIIDSEPVFENMSTQYVDARKLLLSLDASKFDGVATVRAEQGECFVVLEKGSPVYCVCKKIDEIVDSAECLERFLEISKEEDMLVSVYKEREKPEVIVRLKEAAREVLGERVERIEEMLEISGKSRAELLKTIEEIERFTYLFLDKKKAKKLSQTLEETIEEVMI